MCDKTHLVSGFHITPLVIEREDGGAPQTALGRRAYNAPAALVHEAQTAGDAEDPFKDTRAARISDREDESVCVPWLACVLACLCVLLQMHDT